MRDSKARLRHSQPVRQTKLCDLSKSRTVTSSRLQLNSDPSLDKMSKRMTQGWESFKDLREAVADATGNCHQTKLRNRTSNNQTKPCKRSAAKPEEKSRKGKLASLLPCSGQFTLLLLLLHAVTKVQPKFLNVLSLIVFNNYLSGLEYIWSHDNYSPLRSQRCVPLTLTSNNQTSLYPGVPGPGF